MLQPWAKVTFVDCVLWPIGQKTMTLLEDERFMNLDKIVLEFYNWNF